MASLLSGTPSCLLPEAIVPRPTATCENARRRGGLTRLYLGISMCSVRRSRGPCIRTRKWIVMRHAATWSVLALSVGSRAAEQPPDNDTPTGAAGVVEGREVRPFFIQDPTDGLCFSGGTFKRCAVDTLWRLDWESGQLSVRHLAVQEDGEADAHCKMMPWYLRLHAPGGGIMMWPRRIYHSFHRHPTLGLGTVETRLQYTAGRGCLGDLRVATDAAYHPRC